MAPATFVRFTDVADLPNNSFNVLMPSDIDGLTAPPAGSPGYFYRPVDGDSMGGGADRVELFTATMDWVNPQTRPCRRHEHRPRPHSTRRCAVS